MCVLFCFQGYFESLRNEMPHININLFCPGPTFSNFLNEGNFKWKYYSVSKIKLSRNLLFSAFVETPGRKYNVSCGKEDRRLTAERCVS